jgi:serine O-acetyltransferase
MSQATTDSTSVTAAERKPADEPTDPVRAREALRAEAEARARQWRPRFFRNVRADVQRHGRFVTRSVLGLMVFRFGAWALTKPRWIRAVAMKVYGVAERLVRLLTGLHMHCTVLVGERLHLIHSEGPISIHPDVVLGDRVGIMHNVTIGLANEGDGAPVIGNDVFIGTGAVILGPVYVGDNARIAANSLVITNVPANCLAIGVPARVLPRTDVVLAGPRPLRPAAPEPRH